MSTNFDSRDDCYEWWNGDEDLDIIFVHLPLYAEYAVAMGLDEIENTVSWTNQQWHEHFVREGCWLNPWLRRYVSGQDYCWREDAEEAQARESLA